MIKLLSCCCCCQLLCRWKWVCHAVILFVERHFAYCTSGYCYMYLGATSEGQQPTLPRPAHSSYATGQGASPSINRPPCDGQRTFCTEDYGIQKALFCDPLTDRKWRVGCPLFTLQWYTKTQFNRLLHESVHLGGGRSKTSIVEKPLSCGFE